MNGNEIRTKFLEFFAERGHQIVESSSLLPQDDPTLLFVNSGMVQFKKTFTGEEKRDYSRATSSQRCVRAGGKHNDLENVGYTARHHTFFEMLGNFSFGDYFKTEAIDYAWEFLTGVLGIDKSKLWVSVFDDDDEAFELWEKVDGLLDGRIVRMGEKDNFWAMGDTGPCGPCSEIHYDQGPEAGCGDDCQLGCDCDRYLELWNLVFMQFERDQQGNLTPLPRPSIDTGMGLERVASVMQGKYTNYDSDMFTSVMSRISKVCGIDYGSDPKSDTAFKVIVDHCRAATFLIADGVLPSNEGRGYVLRRIMRRAIRYGRTLGLTKPFLAEVTDEVVSQMRGAYPHLDSAVELLSKVMTNEEERFLETIDNGLAILGDELRRLKDAGEKIIAGDFIFKLYDTFGFPRDIVRDMALEVGLSLDDAGFQQAMEVQRAQSKKSWKGADLAKATKGMLELPKKAGQTVFVGYDQQQVDSEIKAILTVEGDMMSEAGLGQEVLVAVGQSPMYAESGGQIGDQGEIVGSQGKARVVDTMKTGDNVFLHKCKIVEGAIQEGDQVTLQVDNRRRRAIQANHTATHLLQAALKEVLGDHVKQSGSLVEEGRLRFDFTNFSPLSPEEIAQVEDLVNQQIRANLQGAVKSMDREEAQKTGATALFGEKYDAVVRVVSFGSNSVELCGGTHVDASGEIGMFKILSETGIAAGVRRILAVTGEGAFEHYRKTDRMSLELAELLKSSTDEVAGKVKNLLARQKELEKEVSQLTAKLSLSDLDSIIEQGRQVNGVKVCTAKIVLDSPKTMREIGDKVRDKMESGVAVLGGDFQGKVALLAIVSKDLTKTYHAGKIIKQVAGLVGGSGGGRADMAQAGGSMVDKIPEALEAVYSIVEQQGT